MRLKIALPMLLFAALAVMAVYARPLAVEDETRYLSVAWEMWLSGDPVHLTRNFEAYTHKPPLLFWLINLVWMATGVNEIAGRLVAPVFALLTIPGIAYLARRFWPDRPGASVAAAVVLVGLTAFSFYGTWTLFDSMLTAAVLVGIAALWRIGQGEGRRAWLMLGLALAFGGMAKGPVILIHLLPPLLTIRWWAPAPPAAGTAIRSGMVSLAVGFALVGVWLVPAVLTGDTTYRAELLWTQSAGRVMGGFAHDRPIWFFLPFLPILLYPWGWSWRLWRGVAGLYNDPAARLCLIWALSGLVLFSVFAGKQVHYLVPELPAMALLFARSLDRSDPGPGGSAAPVGLALFGLAALAHGLGFIPAKGDLVDFLPRWPFLMTGLFCLAVVAAAYRLPQRWSHLSLGVGLVIAMHLPVPFTRIYSTYDESDIARRLSELEAGGILQYRIPQHAEFTFLGRLTRPIADTYDPDALRAWAEAHPGGTVVAIVGRSGITPPPDETFDYFRGTLGLWPAETVSRAP